MKVLELHSAYPSDCETLQCVRTVYAHRNCLIDRGYILYHLSDGSIYEHRLVSEFGHGNIDGLVVHHIDGITTNNSLRNLLPLTRSSHSALHQSPKRIALCSQCGANFDIKQSRIDRYNINYCSVYCRQMADRVVERPSKSELVDLLSATPNFLEVGRQFGVSDNAVRKWCKQYNIPHLTSYWRAA